MISLLGGDISKFPSWKIVDVGGLSYSVDWLDRMMIIVKTESSSDWTYFSKLSGIQSRTILCGSSGEWFRYIIFSLGTSWDIKTIISEHLKFAKVLTGQLSRHIAHCRKGSRVFLPSLTQNTTWLSVFRARWSPRRRIRESCSTSEEFVGNILQV